MMVWCIATQVFINIVTIFSLPSEQFVFSPVVFDNPQRKLQTNIFKSEKTKYSTQSTHTNKPTFRLPTFRLDLPGWVKHAEVIPTKNVEFDSTDQVTGYTAPTFNYFLSQTDSRERIDNSEERESVSNKQLNTNAATSSVYFRLGNSPVTQYKVVHIPPTRSRGNGKRKKMTTIERARFIGMSRNPSDFNPFIAKQSIDNFPRYKNRNQKPDINVTNGEIIQAQYVGKTINPPNFSPFITKQVINKVSQYQDKNQNPYISVNNRKNVQAQYVGENENYPDFNPIVLKPTLLVTRNISLSNNNSKRLITTADRNKEDLLLVNSNAEIKGIHSLDPQLINYQKSNIKSSVTPTSIIKSKFPALFIQNITPKVLIQPQNVTIISDLGYKNPLTSPHGIEGPVTNRKQPQVQLTNSNVQNIPVHKSLSSSVIQHSNFQNIPTQRNLVSFTNTKPIVESTSLQIKLMPSTITQTNLQHIPPIHRSTSKSTFAQPNINYSSLKKNLTPSSIENTNIHRITTQKSILASGIAQSSLDNSSMHKTSTDLHKKSQIFGSEDIKFEEEDSQSQKSEETSIPGTDFKFDLPKPDDTDTYFYSYDIHSNKRPKQFNGRTYGQAEKKENGRITGRYYVKLPDGRIQVVTYHADHTGYHPTVSYFGKKIIDR